MKPGGLLDYLYPLSRYQLDGCILCGHSFREHLVSWWQPFLNTPFDQYLDGVREKSKEWTENETERPVIPHYRYHNAYVKRIKTKDRFDPIKRKKDIKNTGAQSEFDIPWDVRRVNADSVAYKIPRANWTSLGVWSRSILLVARAIVLEEMDTLVFLEERCR
jgi:hypothetical protein